jgi:dynein light chain 4, axonemal
MTVSRQALQQPLVAFSDIAGDARQEVIDTIVGGIDKHCQGEAGDAGMETAARAIKESLDKQYGLSWQVVIGKGFSFDVTSLEHNYMHCYYQGKLGVLAFKTS